MPMMLDTTIKMAQKCSRDQHADCHPKLIATHCGHNIHPSSSVHTPHCPNCVLGKAKASFEAVQEDFLDKGGPNTMAHVRDRPWNLARMKYETAKKRLDAARRTDQLRWEREEAWDDSHRFDSLGVQATAESSEDRDCLACASMMYPTDAPQAHADRRTAWWEQSSYLAVKTSSLGYMKYRQDRSHKPSHHFPVQPVESRYSGRVQALVHKIRAALRAFDARRDAWDIRARTENAIRRKHSLGPDFGFDAEFFSSPIPGLLSLRNHQNVRESQRMAERRARGNGLRPKPPRSSLSYSQSSEDIVMDRVCFETFAKKVEEEELERETRRVAREVGYLYFVGDVDGLTEWREEYSASNQHLVIRTLVCDSDTASNPDEKDDANYGDEGMFDEMEIDDY
ncbi:hypothetical protein ACN47E_004342 [Coniothyrium glycines]